MKILNLYIRSLLCVLIISLITYGCGEKVSESDMRNNYVGIDDSEPYYTYKEGISHSFFNARNGINYYYFFANDYKITDWVLINTLMRVNDIDGHVYLCNSKDVSSGVIIYNKLNRYLISLMHGKDVIGEIEKKLNGVLKSISFTKGDTALASILTNKFGITNITFNVNSGNGKWIVPCNRNMDNDIYWTFLVDTVGYSDFSGYNDLTTEDSLLLNFLKSIPKWNPATIDGVPIPYSYEIGFNWN